MWVGRCPQKLPLPLAGLRPPPNSGLLRLSRYPEQHLDQFVHFIGHTFVSNRHTVSHKPCCIGNNWQWRRHRVDCGGHVYSTFARGRSWNWYKSNEFLQGGGVRGVGPVKVRTWLASRLHTLHARHVCPPTYFDLATPLILGHILVLCMRCSLIILVIEV